MAQKDRYKERVINIDFLTKKHLNDFPIAKQYALICITHGSATGTLNNQAVSLKAPCFLCLNPQDYLSFTQNKLALQAFCFDEEFLKTAPYVPTTEEISESLHLSVGLSLFHQDTRTFFVSKERMNQLRGWMFIMGSEVYAQSDELWICRIKTYLIQILSMLEKIHLETKDTPLDRALCYIYEHYYEDLSLDDLTRQAHLNRVSLNQLFKEAFSCTAIEYLNLYRLKIAKQMLIHTGVTISEIAHAVGYEYDSYFMRTFKKHNGISPTAFRIEARKKVVDASLS